MSPTTTSLTGLPSLTDQPAQIAQGIQAWRNPGNHYVGVLLHFEADPQGATEEERRSGMDEAGYQRENCLSFASFAGKPVYAGFDPAVHMAEPLPFYVPGLPVLRSFDFGYHHPAVVYAQRHEGLWVLGELMGEDVTLDDFVTKFVLPYQAAVFPDDVQYLDFGDPAGRQMNDKSNFTSFGILANHGIFIRSRKSEIDEGLTIIRRELATPRGIKVHPRCRILVQGFKGGYRYPEATTARPQPLWPLKDGFFDHLQDAFRYLVVNNIRLRNPAPVPPKPTGDPPLFKEAMASRGTASADPYKDWE